MNRFAEFWKGRSPYWAVIGLWALFVLPAVTQTGYFYLDDPDQLLMAESGPWWTPPNLEMGRHLPVFNFYRKVVYALVGPTPAAFYFVQSGVILATWLGLFLIVRRLGERAWAPQVVLLTTLVGGSLAEVAFTLGKHEPLHGLLMTGVILATMAYYAVTTRAARAAAAFGLGVLAALSVWNKETAMIFPVIPLVFGFLRESMPTLAWSDVLRRIKDTVPLVLCASLGVFVAKAPMWVAKAGATGPVAAVYTRYDMTADLVSSNLQYYRQQTPEVFVLFGFALLCVAVGWRARVRPAAIALAAAAGVAALGYVAGLSLWRFCLPYYMYPATLLGALALALSAGVIYELSGWPRRFVTILFLIVVPVQLVVVCQNLYLANAQRMATHATQSALDTLLGEIPPGRPARVFLMNFPNPSEPPVQFENYLARHHGRKIECFGGLNLTESVGDDSTAALFKNQKKTPEPVPGDYLVFFPSCMTGPWHIRAVSPSNWSDDAAEALMLGTVTLKSEMRRIHLPVLSWRSLPHLRECRFGVTVMKVTATDKAGVWAGRWSDGWVSKRCGYTPMAAVTPGFRATVSAYAPTVPNVVEILRGDSPLMTLALDDAEPRSVDIPAGAGPVHFRFRKSVSPQAAGINPDTREIAGRVELK